MSENEGIAAAIAAGATATRGEDRLFYATAIYGDTTVEVPYAMNAHGPQYLKEAMEVAQRLSQENEPKRSGNSSFSDMISLLTWTGKYKTTETQAYVQAPGGNTGAGKIQVIIDDMPMTGSLGTNRRHQGYLEFRLSEQLQKWTRVAGQPLSGEEFHAFVDEHADELTNADLVTMATNLEVSSETKWKRTIDPSTGRVKLIDESSAGPTTTIPKRFQFVVPVLDVSEISLKFEATLRLKLEKGKPLLSFEIVDLQQEVLAATKQLADQVAKVVPTYMGRP